MSMGIFSWKKVTVSVVCPVISEKARKFWTIGKKWTCGVNCILGSKMNLLKRNVLSKNFACFYLSFDLRTKTLGHGVILCPQYCQYCTFRVSRNVLRKKISFGKTFFQCLFFFWLHKMQTFAKKRTDLSNFISKIPVEEHLSEKVIIFHNSFGVWAKFFHFFDTTFWQGYTSPILRVFWVKWIFFIIFFCFFPGPSFSSFSIFFNTLRAISEKLYKNGNPTDPRSVLRLIEFLKCFSYSDFERKKSLF